jgi:hypothetical protein
MQFGSGAHGYMKPEEGLPGGIGPAIANVWHTAITAVYSVAS